MGELIEFDPVDTIGAGAYGRPGQRVFLIQARKGEAMLSVLVEKQQVAMLAAEAAQFLENLNKEYPEEMVTTMAVGSGPVTQAEPLFRARLIGLGFDPQRGLVLLELREDAGDDDEDEDDDAAPPIEEAEGRVARLYATRAQVRAMVNHGAEAVASGRPPCPLCEFPMDPEGHICPRWN
jgi:uncharacterized repeat protein (TIGR03847 family)